MTLGPCRARARQAVSRLHRPRPRSAGAAPAVPSSPVRRLRRPLCPRGDPIDPREVVGGGAAAHRARDPGPGRAAALLVRSASGVGPGIRIGGPRDSSRKWASIVDEPAARRGAFSERGARVRRGRARRRAPLRSRRGSAWLRVRFPDPWWKKKRQNERLVLGLAPAAAAGIVVPCPAGSCSCRPTSRQGPGPTRKLLSGSADFKAHGESARVDENPFCARSPREHRAPSPTDCRFIDCISGFVGRCRSDGS